jgi:hypothetical protein
MKKTTLFLLSASLISATLLTSCNKKLKEDIKELDSLVSDLKTKNEALQNQANGLSSILGSNEPITSTTSFIDDNGNTRTWTDTYSFKASGMETQYMRDNNNGTYNIYIERFKDVDWNEGAWVVFTYNPTTGAILGKRAGQYWDWNLPYGSNPYYEDGVAGCTINLTLSNINISTGEISFSLTATGDDAYATNTSYLPNNDKGATTSFSFTGTLSVYPAN